MIAGLDPGNDLSNHRVPWSMELITILDCIEILGIFSYKNFKLRHLYYSRKTVAIQFEFENERGASVIRSSIIQDEGKFDYGQYPQIAF